MLQHVLSVKGWREGEGGEENEEEEGEGGGGGKREGRRERGREWEKK